LSGVAPYQVEHHCPQCSAPIILDENDLLLICPYCRVRLYISFEGYPRYYLPPQVDRDLAFFVPYWRSKGMEFEVRAAGIQESVVDRTWNASRYPSFPPSLGIRPQALRLRLVESGEQRKLLPASLTPDDEPPEHPLTSLMDRDFPEEQDPLLFRAFLRDTFSLIYLPAIEKEGIIHDAIDAKSFGGSLPELSKGDQPVDHSTLCRYHFVPALCPNCGNDLAGEKGSRIVFCQSCMVGFSVSKGTLTDIPLLVAGEGSKTASFLPFWRFSVETRGLPLPRTTGRILPGGRMEQFERGEFCFWVPAFKINPQLLLRLAHRATTARLAVQPLPAMPGISSIPPVTIPSAEAVKTLKLLLLLLSPRDRDLPLRLNDLSIEVKEVTPVLIPFEQTGYELTNRQIQVAVHVNALKYGRNL
jgi:hypothetical protein